MINADDRYASLWRGLASRASRIEFGIDAEADVRAQQIEPSGDGGGSRFVLLTPSGRATVRLMLPGRHNVMNALAAAACGVALGLGADDIARGLAAVEPAGGRLIWKRTPEGARVLDDSYNANPGSLRAAIELLSQLRAHRCLVLGDMAELGAEAPLLHFEAGRQARSLGVERLYALGRLAAEAARGFGPGAEVFDDVAALTDALRARLDGDTVVLVKGSRSARMERVVEQLTGGAQGGTH